MIYLLIGTNLVLIIMLFIAFICTLIDACHSDDDDKSKLNDNSKSECSYVTYDEFLDQMLDIHSDLFDIKYDISQLKNSIPKKNSKSKNSKKDG